MVLDEEACSPPRLPDLARLSRVPPDQRGSRFGGRPNRRAKADGPRQYRYW